MVSDGPVRYSAPLAPADAASPLEHDILQEKAATLGRLGRDLQAAIRSLEEFDRAHSDRTALSAEARLRRTELVGAAGEILWYFVVQREACGLYRSDDIFRDYCVPAEVRIRMGMRPRSTP